MYVRVVTDRCDSVANVFGKIVRHTLFHVLSGCTAAVFEMILFGEAVVVEPSEFELPGRRKCNGSGMIRV